MQSESSAIARKIRELIVIQNQAKIVPIKEEPGIMRNILMIGLMGFAVFFTQITLQLVNWTKRLNG